MSGDMVAFGLLEGNTLFGASALVAGVAATLVIHLGTWNTNQESAGPQNIHVGHTPRLGGVAIFAGYVIALAIALHWALVPRLPALPLLLAAIPICVVGLWEDVAHRVSPAHRLLAAVFSAGLAGLFADGVIPRLDLAPIDRWIAYLPIALPLTLFMVAGACNAFNIIDGSHGLAAGTAVLLFLGIGIVARNAGDSMVFAQAVGMTGALAGFLLWNYPRGKIFLGDAGAYFVGFMYAQLSIQLVARNPGVSAWFVIALAAYPIVEMLYSIYRRRFLHRTAAMQPDMLHLHSLIYVCVLSFAQRERPGDRRQAIWAAAYPDGERRRSILGANARVAPLLWLHGGVCFVYALHFHTMTGALIGFTFLYAIAYVACYRNAVRVRERSSARRMTCKSSPASEIATPEQHLSESDRVSTDVPQPMEPVHAVESVQSPELPRAMDPLPLVELPTAQTGARL